MARTIILDGIELAQVILNQDPTTGKILVKTTYRVKSGSEIVKTTPDRSLTFTTILPEKTQQPDLMTATEQSAASSAWDAVQAALARLELA